MKHFLFPLCFFLTLCVICAGCNRGEGVWRNGEDSKSKYYKNYYESPQHESSHS